MKKVESIKWNSALDSDGFEVPDSTPGPMPVNFKRPLSLQEQVRQMIRISQVEAMDNMPDTVDEEDGFQSVADEDLAIQSPYDLVYDPELKRSMPRFEKIEVDRVREDFDRNLEKARLEKVKSGRGSKKVSSKASGAAAPEAPAAGSGPDDAEGQD